MYVKQISKITVFNVLYFFIGYWSITLAVINFLFAANATKGWNVQNEDGKSLIPLGIIALLILIAFFIINIVSIIRYIINRKKNNTPHKFLINNFKNVSYFIGLIIGIVQYVTEWII